VIARKVFNNGFTFTVEMTEMSMALIVFLGVGLVTYQRGHIVVDVVTLRLSERARVWLELVTNVLSLGFVLIMVWRLCLQAAFIASKGDATPIWNFPLWPIAYLIAAGSIFLVTGLVLHVLDSVDRAAHPVKSAPKAAERPFQDSAAAHAAIDHRYPDPRPACSCCWPAACRSASRWG